MCPGFSTTSGEPPVRAGLATGLELTAPELTRRTDRARIVAATELTATELTATELRVVEELAVGCSVVLDCAEPWLDVQAARAEDTTARQASRSRSVRSVTTATVARCLTARSDRRFTLGETRGEERL